MILDYKNGTIHYKVEGKGKTIVLLHGFLETLDMWNDLVPELSKSNQVLTIDLLGHGKTDCVGYVHTMEDMASAVSTVLKHLKIKKASFIGHSMGGYVALALAEKQPQLFDGLCLMNSTFLADDDQRKDLRIRANEMAKTHYVNLVRMSFMNLFAQESKNKFEEDYENALKLALQTPVQSYIAAQEGMRLRPNRFEVFENVNGQKLIIIGKKDTLINGKKLIHLTKGTTIEYKELSEGHMSHIENKSELSYIINLFVE